jgi:D-glycero-alpha-D-manno-heptose-7-phosphate kinase
VERRQLGAEACESEIDILREPIGSRIKYASALGGINYTRFVKRGLASGITSESIDGWYDRARAASATGGKNLGDGGGGFLLLCVPPERREPICRALPRVDLQFERLGRTIVFTDMQ